MSHRLQVLVEEAEFREIRKVARRHHLTVAEWVRQALRSARKAEPHGDARTKLEAVRAAAQGTFPAGEVSEMLAEIERGYVGGSSE